MIVAANPSFLASAWEVLLLFLLPIGGGIPGGVVLAQKRGFAWRIMVLLYVISDLILACVFEPLMILFLRASEKSPRMAHFKQEMAKSISTITGKYGIRPGPFSLIMITFGTDPMTGRSLAKAAGHGFLSGWFLTIIGDTIYFSVIMASTLWLNNILGDGTATTLIIVVAMLGIPPLFRKLKEKLFGKKDVLGERPA